MTLIVLIGRHSVNHHTNVAPLICRLFCAAVIGDHSDINGENALAGAAITGLLVVARQMLPLLIRLLPMLGSLRVKPRTVAKNLKCPRAY